ncbi:MAG: hypothetical protein IKC63_07595 [Clostridia bacterium]|nr:hypothetical protein [Clostridia bacterium]
MKRSKRAFIVLCALTFAALTVMVAVLCLPPRQIQGAFVPPAFDGEALIGTPSVPEGLGYRILEREGMAYRVGICGKVEVKAGRATVFLTNPSDNTVWLKLRIYDRRGNILGESGLVRPGEYLPTVALHPGRDTKGMTFKIMSYEKDTYQSLGAITVTPAVSDGDTED